MFSESVLKLCQNTETVSSALAETPEEAPGNVVKRLYGPHATSFHPSSDEKRPIPSLEASEMALKCGRWGSTKPSRLFLQAFADSLNSLDLDPMSGVVSPPLMGSYGTMPLTVIAPLADVIRHISNLIVRAEKEIFLITCEWSRSEAQRLIKNALIELSRRVGERGQRVVVKIMYDKATVMNALNAHQYVQPATYGSEAIQLPLPNEIPNVDLEVISLHKLVLGTLHCKFCVVDRKVAAIMSNNMEDNSNMEMMTNVEGPIVDGIYDTALITWNNHFSPPLPLHAAPATEDDLLISCQELLYLDRGIGRSQDQIVGNVHAQVRLPEHTSEDPHYDSHIAGEIARMQSCYTTKSGETRLQAVNRQLNLAAKAPVTSTGPEIPDGEEMTPYISTATAYSVPMALVSRPPYGRIDFKSVRVPQNEAWLSLIRNAKHNIFIQTPDLNAAPLISALAAALKRGVEVTYYVCFGYNDSGEMIPGQGGTNEQAAQCLISLLPLDGPERKRLHIYDYVAKDQDHPIHQSFKSRSCHIKLLIADSSVGIQGSGNQDTQSWFHSQEINIMVDSEEICGKWRDGIEGNQNTKAFGRVAKDGVWRGKDGKPGEGYMGNPGQVEALFKGIWGMLKKMERV